MLKDTSEDNQILGIYKNGILESSFNKPSKVSFKSKGECELWTTKK